MLLGIQDIYALEFTGKRYDVGDKLGFLKATCEFALENGELEKGFRDYLCKLVEKECKSK